MEKQILTSILEAEKRADEIIEKAEEAAREILSAGREKAARALKDAEKLTFSHRKDAALSAQKVSSEHFDKIVSEGKEAAKRLISSSAEKVSKAADYITEEALVDKWL